MMSYMTYNICFLISLLFAVVSYNIVLESGKKEPTLKLKKLKLEYHKEGYWVR